jgi:leucyl/phenylalanyl-tRNA---protein transferase
MSTIQTRPNPELTPALLLQAYAAGFFPMAEGRTGPISWFSPDPRAIIPLNGLKVSRSLRQAVKKKCYEIRIDTAFRDVMRACASREETWISDEIIDAYCGLFESGHAHSVETWQTNRLVGGLYGVSLRGAFFGESMFSLERDASKIALLELVRKLQNQGFLLLDTQYLTPHLASMGACEIPRDSYISLLHDALEVHASFIEQPLHV